MTKKFNSDRFDQCFEVSSLPSRPSSYFALISISRRRTC